MRDERRVERRIALLLFETIPLVRATSRSLPLALVGSEKHVRHGMAALEMRFFSLPLVFPSFITFTF